MLREASRPSEHPSQTNVVRSTSARVREASTPRSEACARSAFEGRSWKAFAWLIENFDNVPKPKRFATSVTVVSAGAAASKFLAGLLQPKQTKWRRNARLSVRIVDADDGTQFLS
jgi:hypothetical protein